jgi:hypothetical protein
VNSRRYRYLSSEFLKRGYQPKCLKCAKDCKVRAASNSWLICYDFIPKEKKKCR